MKTIKSFVRSGFAGPDASLAISLFEYRLIWKRTKKDWEFVAPCLNRKGYYSHFFFAANTDIKKEFNWVSDWDSFLSCVGNDWDGWNKQELPLKIFDLINYFGQIEILGDDYGRGYPVREE